MTRQHRGFTHVHPPGLSLTRGPWMEQRPFGLNPGLRTPQSPRGARQGGNRSPSTDLGYVTVTTASHRRIHLTRATSCRTSEFVPFLDYGACCRIACRGA